MLATILLLGFTLAAAITDCLWQRIFNWTTYPGILAGLLVSTLEPGGVGWEDSLMGLVGCGLIMVICFITFQVGGGDVKLITMQGAFLGWYHGLECMLWTFVLGSALGLSILIWKFGILKIVSRLIKQMWWLIRHQAWLPLSAEERMALQPKLHLAPAALAAVIIVRFSLFR